MEQMLNVYIDAALHMELKVRALEEKKTMKQLVNEIITEHLGDTRVSD